MVPAKTGLIPAEKAMIPVRTGLIPAEKGLIPVRTGLIPAEKGLIPDVLGWFRTFGMIPVLGCVGWRRNQ